MDMRDKERDRIGYIPANKYLTVSESQTGVCTTVFK